MINLGFTHDLNEQEWGKEMVRQLSAYTSAEIKVRNNLLTLPSEIGTGTIRYFVLEEGLRLFSIDGYFNYATVLGHKADQYHHDSYIVYFNISTAPVSCHINNIKTLLGLTVPNAVYCCSLGLNSVMHVEADTRIAIVGIILTRKFIDEHIRSSPLPISNPQVRDFVENRSPYFYISMDSRIFRLTNLIIQADISYYLQRTYIKGCAFKLLAICANRIIIDREIPESGFKLNDIDKIISARNYLISDFEKHVPTIDELAEKAGMSPTKFKKMFKEVFYMPPYEYYQNKCMERAKELLDKQSYTVSEVGYKVGFSSLGHFTAAFRKRYGRNPRDYLREIKSTRKQLRYTLIQSSSYL